MTTAATVTPSTHTRILEAIATEIGARVEQVAAAVALLDEGATVPFIARYRKEVTGGLDDTQLRTLEERLVYLRELEDRRAKVLESIREQGKLTPELERAILLADSKTRLEDLYRPYVVKRRTKAQIAREAGLEPLADGLLADPTQDPSSAAAAYVSADKGVEDVAAALEGARQILMERFADDPELATGLREYVWSDGRIRAKVVAGKESDASGEAARFQDYFDHVEPLAAVPSHRALAMLRGRKEDVLSLDLLMDPEDERLGTDTSRIARTRIARRFGIEDKGRPADEWLTETARAAWRLKLAIRIETEVMTRLREEAEREAIAVFARNLRALLLAAPAGPKAILGLDPGLRTGVKVAVVDRTGKVVATDTIYPTPPRNEWERSLVRLAELALRHDIELISIGNGTGSRETDRLAIDLIKRLQAAGAAKKLQKVVVNEAGASVYSASELASRELPDLDVSLRGAASIARRLQDPLAELVKIEPKAIGVGQYQHDVNQHFLSKSLDAVIEDCVNAVGVDVNTASPALLTRVAGLSTTLAENVVTHRNANGPFKKRRQILDVPRLGPKAFEQAAGFLRIMDGDDPLDRSSVHPEAYPVVERIAKATGRTVASLVGDAAFLRSVDPAKFTDERFGLPTVKDILTELEKPGRDPRPEFKTATFADGVEDMKDLTPGMILEGVVTNVTNFGAFVDVGVHQDGLVHISQLSHTFVQDPNEVVKAGQVVRVKVQEVDLPRKRIALTMRLDDEARPRPREERGDGARGTNPRGVPGGNTRGGGGNPRGGAGSTRGGYGGSRGRDDQARSFELPPPPKTPNAFAKAFADLQAKKGKPPA